MGRVGRAQRAKPQLECGAPAGGTAPVERLVRDDAQQPGPEGRAGAERAQRGVRLEQRLLYGILGLGGVARDQPGGAEGERLLAARELLVGGQVAAPRRVKQLALVAVPACVDFDFAINVQRRHPKRCRARCLLSIHRLGRMCLMCHVWHITRLPTRCCARGVRCRRCVADVGRWPGCDRGCDCDCDRSVGKPCSLRWRSVWISIGCGRPRPLARYSAPHAARRWRAIGPSAACSRRILASRHSCRFDSAASH